MSWSFVGVLLVWWVVHLRFLCVLMFTACEFVDIIMGVVEWCFSVSICETLYHILPKGLQIELVSSIT